MKLKIKSKSKSKMITQHQLNITTRKHRTNRTNTILVSSSSIRFYDNDMKNIKHFREKLPQVESIMVDNDKNKEILDGEANSLYTIKFLEKYPTNKFALYLKSINNKEIGTDIGFSKNDVKNLKQWVKKNNKKAVIFDWDGCITTIEGIIIPTTNKEEDHFHNQKITDLEIALYYAGGTIRFNMLRNMFELLHKKNIHVFILTNNPTASTVKINNMGPNARDNFYKIAKQIIPQIHKDDILCGYDDDCFKPTTFLKNIFLSKYISDN